VFEWEVACAFLNKKHVFIALLEVWFVLKRYCTFDKKPPHLQAKHALRTIKYYFDCRNGTTDEIDRDISLQVK
jgi:hypothetical protein